jgi:Tfp pilus assembly protein PilX
MQARLDEMKERHSSLTRDAARLQSAAKHALRAQAEALNSTSNTAHSIAG